MKNNYHIIALLIATLALPFSDAFAQGVDYGSLQSLFGEPITTSATGTPQRASDVPANMTIITADEIRQSGTRSIPLIIGRYVPGVDIFQSGLNSFDVGMRGYQQPFQPRLLVLIDGRQVFIDDYSRTIWASLPVNIDDIRQIEVVKGTASALFGSNATGGVVNIITYNPVYYENNVASVGLGTQGKRTADATVSRKLGNYSGIKISGGGMNASEFDTDNNPSDIKVFPPRQRYVASSSSFQLIPELQANLGATYSESRDNSQQPNISGRAAEDAATYSVRGGFEWQSPYGLIINDNYLNHTSLTTNVAGVTYPHAVNLYVSKLEDQFKAGVDNTLRMALEYRHKYFNLVDYPNAFGQAPRTDNDVYAASGSWLWQVNNKLSWTNALRLEHQDSAQTGNLFPYSLYSNSDYSYTINDVSANSGIVYKATDMDTIRATYGRGVQLPSFIETSDNILVQQAPNIYLDLEGNPHLKPTIVQNYELDYERRLPDIYSTLKFATFYQINQDIISFLAGISPTPRFAGGNALIFIQSLNVGDSRGLGGEIELKGNNPAGFRWDASYSYARDTDSASAGQFLGYDGSTPAHHFRLAGGYTTGKWELDASGQAVTSLHMQSSIGTKTYTSGYFTLESRVGYKITDNITASLSGINLTSANTQESPFPAIERQVLLGLTGKF